MKDFIKIFLVLCVIVGAFFYGRSYGEKTSDDSIEVRNLKSENFQSQTSQQELDNLKIKFQNLLDSSDLKKADEVLGKIMTIFLADLSLRVSDEKQKDFLEGKRLCSQNQINEQVAIESVKKETEEPKKEIEVRQKPEDHSLPPPIKNLAQFKLNEFSIMEAQDTDEILRTLDKLEVKKIDSLTNGADQASYEQSKKFLGSYRGSLIGADKKVYGTLVMNIELSEDKTKPFKGIIELFRNGSVTSRTRFASSSIGLSGNQSQSTIIDVGDGSSYLQTYKIDNLNKIAGIYYDRLPNGTSKTIGTVVLSRTDI